MRASRVPCFKGRFGLPELENDYGLDYGGIIVGCYEICCMSITLFNLVLICYCGMECWFGN